MNWHSETRKLADLKPATYNPRRMTEKQAQDLETSIDRFALADPLVINLDNTIIGGHMRYRILRKRGVAEADVRVPDRQLTEAEERELNLRLNKNLGEWDFDLLSGFDEALLKDVGFGEDLFPAFSEVSEKADRGTKMIKCPKCGHEFSQ